MPRGVPLSSKSAESTRTEGEGWAPLGHGGGAGGAGRVGGLVREWGSGLRASTSLEKGGAGGHS